MTDPQTTTADAAHGSARISPRDLYRFDVEGYLVVRGALTPDEVARLNEAADANQDKLTERHNELTEPPTLTGTRLYYALGAMEWPKPWCDPFRSLIAHRSAIPYLNAFLGRGWHLDHGPEYFQQPKGGRGFAFHGGEYHFQYGIFYHYKAGQIRTGLTVLQWALADGGGDLGGFACIPGTHKANFPRPEEISLYLEDQDMMVCPEVKAGDLIIFSESTTHGALPWRADHDRRAILNRYAPLGLQFTSGFPGYVSYRLPEWVEELDEVSRVAMEPGHVLRHFTIADDGSLEPGLPPDRPPFPYS